MDTTSLTMLFHEKLALYGELIEALKMERRWIIAGQTEGLWQMTDRKRQIVSNIEAARHRILQGLTDGGISHDMAVGSFRASRVLTLLPLNQRKPLLEIQNKLLLSKMEVQQRTRENMSFVEGYLETLDNFVFWKRVSPISNPFCVTS